jgi:hypothetical protein
MEKATITNTVTGGDPIEVQFNPEEYTLSRANNFAPIALPGRESPLLQFVHGEMKTLQMELFFDTVEAHPFGTRPPPAAQSDVRVQTRKLTSLMDIDPTTHAPPVLLFSWGQLTFLCVLASVTQRFVLFRDDGVPLRARLQVTFNEYRNPDSEAKEIKRQTADYSKIHVVEQGETIYGIANRAYGDPTLWRPIALYNQLDDARVLRAGDQLRVPPLPYRDLASGVLFEATGDSVAGTSRPREGS